MVNKDQDRFLEGLTVPRMCWAPWEGLMVRTGVPGAGGEEEGGGEGAFSHPEVNGGRAGGGPVSHRRQRPRRSGDRCKQPARSILKETFQALLASLSDPVSPWTLEKPYSVRLPVFPLGLGLCKINIPRLLLTSQLRTSLSTSTSQVRRSGQKWGGGGGDHAQSLHPTCGCRTAQPTPTRPRAPPVAATQPPPPFQAPCSCSCPTPGASSRGSSAGGATPPAPPTRTCSARSGSATTGPTTPC